MRRSELLKRLSTGTFVQGDLEDLAGYDDRRALVERYFTRTRRLIAAA